MTYSKWGRMITFLNEFMAVDDVTFADESIKNVTFKDHQGYIGLAPYSADLDRIDSNFLWQMKDQGILDHMVTSFYFDGDNSLVKFGSYDPLGLKPGTKLTMFKTENVRNW